jgi:3-deoxy-D-manno-octulosonate 8-phosphate phosphatase (KDO 8-P phosphatase)
MEVLGAFENVHTFMFDVDGVLTDGRVLITEQGELLRTMNVKDGFALHTAVQLGYRVVIITGGRSHGTYERLKKLGVQHIFIGVGDKLEPYNLMLAEHQLDEEGILYMGDDLPDVSVMRRVGLPVCPADAVAEVLAVSRYRSPYVGGAGCVRDVIEKVLRLHGKWPPTEARIND